jgi:putative tryptophan/tyrosine transport system substrate-binding protein
MNRRAFIRALGGAAAPSLLWPLPARAQQGDRVRRIGALMVRNANDEEGRAAATAFEQGLEKLGRTVGRNLQIDYRWGIDEVERARLAAAELLALRPEVIVANGTLATAALQKVTRTTPIVFTAVTEPIEQGFVQSLAHPGGNITGLTNLESSVASKWLEVLKEIAPQVARVAIIFNADTAPYLQAFARSGQAAAEKLALKLSVTQVHEAVEIEPVMAMLSQEPGGGLVIPPDAFMSARHRMIIELAARYRLPAIYQFRYFAADGGLVSYGIDLPDLYRRSASYIDRILRGEKPADLPVQQPTKFELVINLKTAKALGLTVSDKLIAIADEVIE